MKKVTKLEEGNQVVKTNSKALETRTEALQKRTEALESNTGARKGRVTQLETNERAAWEIHAVLDLTKSVLEDAVSSFDRTHGTRYTSRAAATQRDPEEKLQRVLEELFMVGGRQVMAVEAWFRCLALAKTVNGMERITRKMRECNQHLGELSFLAELSANAALATRRGWGGGLV